MANKKVVALHYIGEFWEGESGMIINKSTSMGDPDLANMLVTALEADAELFSVIMAGLTGYLASREGALEMTIEVMRKGVEMLTKKRNS